MRPGSRVLDRPYIRDKAGERTFMMGAIGPKVSSITTSIAEWCVSKRDCWVLGGQTVVDIYEHLRSDIDGSAIEMLIRCQIHNVPYIDIIYLLAAGKWFSAIRAFAPAATTARINVRSGTWLRDQPASATCFLICPALATLTTGPKFVSSWSGLPSLYAYIRSFRS